MPYRQIEHEAYKDVSQVVLTIEGPTSPDAWPSSSRWA